jgi:carbon storage regulator
MLVLTRKIGQTLVIGDCVTITVVSISNGKVRIGIQAPPTVRVDRGEIHERRVGQPLDAAPPGAAAPPRKRPGFRRSHLVKPSVT